MALPRFIGLQSKSNSKYLHYIKEDVEARGFLRSTGEEVVSPYAKYEVQIAKNWDGLVHIRCVYNNKYFVSKSQGDWWIVAGAREPDEDKSKWSCTLFEPVFVDVKTIRFRHVQLGHYVTVRRTGNAFDYCIYAGCQAVDNDQNDVFTITDWESLSILPKYVAFKGGNGKYLSCVWLENHEYLQFRSDDIGDPWVGHETFTTSDGSIRIKSNYYGKFWKCSPNWIWTNSIDTSSNDLHTLFRVVKVDDHNTVSLRSVGNKSYCRRLTAECKTDYLSASVSTISKEARMQVEERVLSRSIYNVKYHLQESRIYDETVITLVNGNAVNMSRKSTTVDICRLSYKEVVSKIWSTSVSVKTGIKTNFRAGIPIIAEGVITVSAEVTGQWQWGTAEESSTELETVYTVTVPPMTAVRVSLLATKGSCDVPFSYYQRDVLMNGETVIYNMDDGVYTGVNYYNFKYDAHQEDL